MRRVLSLICFLTILMMSVCAATAAAAAQSEAELTEVICEEQGFAVMMPGDCTAEWIEDDGLRIWAGTPGYVPNILIWRREKKLNNPVRYVKEQTPAYYQDELGSSLVGTTVFESYDIGGKEHLATEYIYKDANNYNVYMLHLVDLRSDMDVEYYARYTSSDREKTLNALDIALRSFRSLEEEAPNGLKDVYCESQDFSISIPEELESKWIDDAGLRVFTGTPGYIPHITVWRRSGNLNDPDNYVRNVYREYMEEQYGENYRGGIFYDSYQAGGKDLYAAKYYYRASNTNLTLMHLVEVRPGGDVEYTVRYIEGDDGLPPAELDDIIRSYTEGKPGAKPEPGKTDGPQTEPVVLNTAEYNDGRFHIQLPSGWKIKTTGDYSYFSFRMWDPQAPDRSVFFFFKLEPFLKSQAAKEAYQSVVDGTQLDDFMGGAFKELMKQIYESMGGGEMYRLYADAPVMESCTLDAFLAALPALREYGWKYYSTGMMLDPSVHPDINDAKIIEKTESSYLCPASCPDNSFARITYKNDQGSACEGLVTAQPVETIPIEFFGTDGAPYTVYLFTGVTTPSGELDGLSQALMGCLGSFGFEEKYVKDAVGLSNDEKEMLLAQGEMMQAMHDAMAQAWDELLRN